MIAPRIPINTRPRITNPIGIRGLVPAGATKERVASGGGGVKVGKRVAVVWTWKAAARVGLMVGVV